MKIDAHHHFWDLAQASFDYGWLDAPEMARINRSFLPVDLQSRLRANGVDGTVLIQTQHDLEENRWALRLAQEHDWIAGVVGWVDLTSPACNDQLAEFLPYPKFVGIRHVVQDETDPDFVVQENVGRGLKVLEDLDVPFDLLVRAHQLKHAATLAERFPGLRIVIDHLGKPGIKNREWDDWSREVDRAARFPNVWCKLSGMITEADWDHWRVSDLKPYADRVIERFGPERILFGSDWPVCELAGSYDQVMELTEELLGSLSQAERNQIFGASAVKFYGLEDHG